MKNCCPNNNCVEIVPSGCVEYTGTPTPGGLIASIDDCHPYLNDILKLLDDNAVLLDARVGLNKTLFDAANTSCGTTPVISTNGITVKDDKYYSAEVVIKLVGVICELRSRLNYLTTEDINSNLGNLHWEDLPLSPSFKLFLADKCLPQDPCYINGPNTLGELLKAIVTKLCLCCP